MLKITPHFRHNPDSHGKGVPGGITTRFSLPLPAHRAHLRGHPIWGHPHPKLQLIINGLD